MQQKNLFEEVIPPAAFPKYRSRFGKQTKNAHTVFQNAHRGEVELSITLFHYSMTL